MQLVFTSQVRSSVTLKDLGRLYAHASAQNTKRHITGVLLYTSQHFAQRIEGPASSVVGLWDRLQRDSRHHHVQLRRQRVVKHRHFSNWDMVLGLNLAALTRDGDAADRAGSFRVGAVAARLAFPV